MKDEARHTTHGLQLHRLLKANDFDGLRTFFETFFASTPYDWYTNYDIARYQGYYASVFYSYFAGMGLDITVEDHTNRGRIDLVVRFNDRVYLFEFKVVEQASESAALAQLRDRGYAEKYRHLAQPIHLVGVEFSRESRNIVAFDTALDQAGD